nr:glycosyltransferase family 87 protein [Pseudonocardia sp. C8]
MFVVLCVPLALLAPLEAYRLTVLLGAVLLAGSLAAVAVACRLEPRLAVPATVALLVSSPVLGTLGLGQVYPVLTAGLVAAWLAARATRPVAEGVALGLVVALKPSLAPVLLVPALQGRLPGTAAGALTAVVATGAGALVTGPAALATWAASLLRRPAQTYADNASLPATLARLTTDSGSGSPVAVVPGGFAAGVVLGLLAVSVALWRAHRDGDGGGTGLWAVAAAALLLSPVSWHNYLTLLMPGVLVLLARRDTALAAPLLALPLIGMEWPGLWSGSGVPASAVPASLYCAILVLYAVALLPRRT